MFVQDNQEVTSNDIRSFLVISVHDPDESFRIHPRYEWTNEADYVFSKEGPQVEVPYVGHSLEMS